MPPKEKQQLTNDQTSLLQWWVNEGAPFDKKVKELQQSEKMKLHLASLQNTTGSEPSKSTMVPETTVAPADAQAMAALKDKSVVVVPVASNSNYLVANFVTAQDFTDKDMALLLPLKKQLIWLKAGNTKIGDSALTSIGQCTELRLLQLNHTSITDRSLGALNKLKHLVTLNLVGTAISLQGLKQLKPLQQLESLYLFQTGISKEQLAEVQQIFPKTRIELGGYQLPKLVSDTTEVQFKPYK